MLISRFLYPNLIYDMTQVEKANTVCKFQKNRRALMKIANTSTFKAQSCKMDFTMMLTELSYPKMI